MCGATTTLSSRVNDRPTKVSRILKMGGLRWKKTFFYNRDTVGFVRFQSRPPIGNRLCEEWSGAALGRHPTLDDAIPDGALVTSHRSPLEVAPSADPLGARLPIRGSKGVETQCCATKLATMNQ
jgi:hypothetical protein